MTTGLPAPEGWGTPYAPPAPPPPEPVDPRPPVSAKAIVCLVSGGLVLALLVLLAMPVEVKELRQVTGTDPRSAEALANMAKIAIGLAAGLLAWGDQIRAVFRGRMPRFLRDGAWLMLAVAAVVAYFNGFQFGYPAYYHRWEQFHTYVGAKYFPELGYERLYRCALIAQDELGTVSYVTHDGHAFTEDLHAEARASRNHLRDIGGTGMIVPAAAILAEPKACTSHFTAERWQRFKQDVRFFRMESGRDYWSDMQTDQGYNMSPVWTVGGRLLAELHPASVRYQQLLAALDPLLLFAMFAALFWAFGMRIAALGAVVWGCQAIAPFYWTGGAFLRQDWLFWSVLGVCLLRKRHFRLAGAALAYAALLSAFQIYLIAALLAFVAVRAVRARRIVPSHRHLVVGGGVAAVLLMLGALLVAGPGSFSAYAAYREARTQSPLTNHMGLTVLVAQDLAEGAGSGRMEFARDEHAVDPFAQWKRLRLERLDRLAWLRWTATGLVALAFVFVLRRLRTPWLVACLAPLLVVTFTTTLCWQYGFLALAAPLARARRWLELPLVAFAVATQLIAGALYWNDTKYMALSAVTLLLFLVTLVACLKLSGRRRRAAAGPRPKNKSGKRRRRGRAPGSARDRSESAADGALPSSPQET